MISEQKIIKFLRKAEFSAQEESKDPSTKVCALILDKDSWAPRTWGYNGMPRKADETRVERWERPEKYKWVEHAERNAIANCARLGIATEGATMVVNMFPCIECARMIVQAGIKNLITIEPDLNNERDVRWKEDYERSRQLFQECEIEVYTIEEKKLNLEPIRQIAHKVTPYLPASKDHMHPSTRYK